MSDIETPEDSGSNARKELAAYVERIERLLEQKAVTSEDIKAAYAEAAGAGFDKKALKQIIKERVADTEKTVLHRSTVNVYRRALGALTGTPLGDWARSWISREAKLKMDEIPQEAAELNEFMNRRKTSGDKKPEGDVPSPLSA
jgi:uncharacterized protein (UPF0335 family)